MVRYCWTRRCRLLRNFDTLTAHLQTAGACTPTCSWSKTHCGGSESIKVRPQERSAHDGRNLRGLRGFRSLESCGKVNKTAAYAKTHQKASRHHPQMLRRGCASGGGRGRGSGVVSARPGFTDLCLGGGGRRGRPSVTIETLPHTLCSLVSGDTRPHLEAGVPSPGSATAPCG